MSFLSCRCGGGQGREKAWGARVFLGRKESCETTVCGPHVQPHEGKKRKCWIKTSWKNFIQRQEFSTHFYCILSRPVLLALGFVASCPEGRVQHHATSHRQYNPCLGRGGHEPEYATHRKKHKKQPFKIKQFTWQVADEQTYLLSSTDIYCKSISGKIDTVAPQVQVSLKPPFFSTYSTISGYRFWQQSMGSSGISLFLIGTSNFRKAEMLGWFDSQNLTQALSSRMDTFQ